MSLPPWDPIDPPLPVVVFADLDDTLFRSRRRYRGPADGLGRPVTVTTSGEPYSYMSPAQDQLFAWLRAGARLIPTTARTVAAYRRVGLPFDDLAIVCHGGVLLRRDGTECPVWRAEVEAALCALPTRPAALAEAVRALPEAADLRVDAVGEPDRPLYVLIRDLAYLDRTAALRPALDRLDLAGWRVEPRRDELVLCPRELGKAAAVRHVIAHHLPDRVLLIGAGDRRGDLPFMRACHFALVPTDAALFEEMA